MTEVPEVGLVFFVMAMAGVAVAGALYLMHIEYTYTGDSFRFHIHQSIAIAAAFIAASSCSNVVAQQLGAHIQLVRWPFLGLLFWMSAGLGLLFFQFSRFEARRRGIPFWPLSGDQSVVYQSNILAALFEAHSSAVCALIDVDNRYVSASSAFETYFGRHPRDVVGRPVTDIWPDAVARTIVAHLATARRTGCRIQTMQIMPQVTGEHDRWNVDYSCISHDGGLVCMAGINVTQAKRDVDAATLKCLESPSSERSQGICPN